MKRKKLAPVGLTVMVADIKARVANDGRFPTSRRASTLSSLSMLPTWANAHLRPVPELNLGTMAFNERTIARLFENLTSATAGVSRKRIQNARADCRFVMERYGLCRKRLRVTLSSAAQEANNRLQKFERIGIAKLLAYVSVHGIDPLDMNDAMADEFWKWARDCGIKSADRVCRRAIDIWNQTRSKTGWPEITLVIPGRRQPWAINWEKFPPPFESAVDAFFVRGDKASLFASGLPVADRLAETTVIGQKECIRWAASALVRSGLELSEIQGLRDVCSPERYKRALNQLAQQKGHANSTVGLVAYVLAKIAKHGRVLAQNEVEEVKAAHESVRRAVKHHMRDQVDRDQLLLDQLDDPKVLDVLLTLARRTVRRVLTSGKKTYRDAVAVQMALIVELWFCAPIRLSNMRQLRLDQHFFRVQVDGVERVAIRIPGVQVKNRKGAEHFLTDDAVELLHLYTEQFLPIITKNNPSPWLIPGKLGKPKTAQALRMQTSKFVREDTGLRFHPHVIRKITTKIYLDQDPGGIEVMRRTLGDAEAITRRVYSQHINRASQRKYVNALESRRLLALSPMVRVRKKG